VLLTCKRNIIASLFFLVFLHSTSSFSQDLQQDPSAYPVPQPNANAPNAQAYPNYQAYPDYNELEAYREQEGELASEQNYAIALSPPVIEDVRYRPHDGLRIFAETGVGLLVSAAFATATAYTGYSAIIYAILDNGGNAFASMIGMFSLSLIAPAAIGGGIHLTGHFMQNQGEAWAPYLGSYAGMALGITMYLLVNVYASSDSNRAAFWSTYIIGWTLPVIGAVLGYELSDTINTKEEGIRWTPYASVSPDLKSGHFGLRLEF